MALRAQVRTWLFVLQSAKQVARAGVHLALEIFARMTITWQNISQAAHEDAQGVSRNWGSGTGLLQACFGTYDSPKGFYVTTIVGANYF